MQEQISHGGLPADDPRRNPAPETVDHDKQAEILRQGDRQQYENQGSKEAAATPEG